MKVVIINDTDVWYPSPISSGQTEDRLKVMHAPNVTQQKHIRVAVVRLNRFIAASNPMKGDGGIDGSSGGSLCNVLCDERSEAMWAWRKIYLILSPQNR